VFFIKSHVDEKAGAEFFADGTSSRQVAADAGAAILKLTAIAKAKLPQSMPIAGLPHQGAAGR